jgi:glucosamine--fructose-6-phosphate aminotransferase (isomerizing)
MCGIAGLVYETHEGGLFSWDEFQSHLDRVLPMSVEDSADGPVLSELESLFLKAQYLKEFSSIRAIAIEPERRAQAQRWASDLTAWESRLAESLEQAEQMETAQLERWNKVLVQARDLTWAVREDVLAFLPRMERLLAGRQTTPWRLFQAWKLVVALENIGRMEVRGRDSCGISCRITVGDAQYQDFLSKLGGQQRIDWQVRQQPKDFVNYAARVFPNKGRVEVLFSYKVAMEVGALGDNVRALYESVTSDEFFWLLVDYPESSSLIYSHSRWASNGIISEPNCHPVDEVTLGLDGRPGNFSGHFSTACLNGDVDNYQEIKARIASTQGRTISENIGTDAKIVPVLFDWHLSVTGSAEEAFCKMVSECEGSFAIVLETTADPDRLYLALKGSGQSLFVGLMNQGYVFASELYGVVEQTPRFIRMDGTAERVPGHPETAGQILILDKKGNGDWQAIRALAFDGSLLELSKKECKIAEITTRDIDRKDFRHYLHKEISEAPSSVEKTLRGKFVLRRDPYRVEMSLGESVLPARILNKVIDGSIRRVLFIGQGTAAVAGQAVSIFMEQLFGNRLSVGAMKATELSGYRMTERMDDCLIVAISQSGTTTDTNRTIDMARERGAAVVGIVNRRNSDMTFKVDGVLYTSDGRDIEMSVASTKAFYSQVVAGYLLVFRLAQVLGALSEENLYRELEELSRLPALMHNVLGDETQKKVRELARAYAPAQRDWAVVGSGVTRAAADEIRIKLAELCYKSIATDQIEDKKHIDLSSEPLTLVLTAGLSQVALRDAVKEVAIFRSHKSVPIVVCSEDFEAFGPYAAGVISVPKASPCASVLLNVVVGHLWGYFCALAIDEGAERLREARAMAVLFYTMDGGVPRGRELGKVVTLARRFQEDLVAGRFNSSLSVQVATELTSLLGYLVGTRSLSQFASEFQSRGNPRELVGTLITVVSKAIHELSRPIDAIKHQAKTITVGISRTEEIFEGPVFAPFTELGLSPEAVPYRDAVILRSLNSVLLGVKGASLYEVENLGPLGEPIEDSTLSTLRKTGVAASMISRSDKVTKLIGTKEWTVRNASLYLGRGSKDRRSIAIVPLIPRGRVEKLVLLHLEFQQDVSLQGKVGVLQDLRQRYENLKSLVTERDVPWRDEYLDPLPVEDLILVPVKDLALKIIESQKAKV